MLPRVALAAIVQGSFGHKLHLQITVQVVSVNMRLSKASQACCLLFDTGE